MVIIATNLGPLYSIPSYKHRFVQSFAKSILPNALSVMNVVNGDESVLAAFGQETAAAWRRTGIRVVVAGSCKASRLGGHVAGRSSRLSRSS